MSLIPYIHISHETSDFLLYFELMIAYVYVEFISLVFWSFS